MKYLIGFLFLFIAVNSLSAQFYEFGQDPASLKWRQIDTEHFKIVFPSDFAENGQTLAKLMEKNYLKNTILLNHQPSKIPLIIHNQTVYSNAFVTWAPKRMEFFTFPDPDMIPIDWLEELSLHEYRHVIQIDKVNQGFTHVLSIVLGQQATGVIAGMMPLWFIEGDAVSAETVLSNSGRGRLPSFEMGIKAQLLSDKRLYSLNKAYLGSYKDFVPNYYELGYQMVSFARSKYGQDYWTNALNYIARRPFLVSPYYFYSKKTTGGGQNIMYKNTMASLKKHWTETSAMRASEPLNLINIRSSREYASYTHPWFLNDSTLVVLKNSLDKLTGFVKLNIRGEEDMLFIPGSLVSGRFSVFENKILWDEYVQDVRWTNRSYSVLKEFNIATGEKRTLTFKSKYTSPSWSPSGDSIVAVKTSADYKFSLVILSSENVKVLANIPSPGNSFLEYPEWIKGSHKIAAIVVSKTGKSIMCYDIETKTWAEILNAGFVNIDQLKSEGDYLFFNAGFTGIDEIYSYKLSEAKLSKLSNSEFGAFYPDVFMDKGLLAYSSYGSKGYDVIFKSVNLSSTEEFTLPDTIYEQSFSSINLHPDTSVHELVETQVSDFIEKPYHKATNLFRFHSWAPYWFDYMDPNIDDPQISLGITLLSQNELSTAFTSLGYERINGTNLFHTGITYKGFVPVIDFSTTYGGVSSVAADTILNNLLPALNSSLSAYVPLTLSSGKVLTGIQPSLNLSYNSAYFYSSKDDAYKSGIGFVEPGFYMYSYLRTTIRDLQPRLGFTFNAKLSSAVFDNESRGSIGTMRINFYLPGIIRNQGFKLKGEWQNQESNLLYFQNQLVLPRGYLQKTLLKMDKYSVDYAFPIMYPDISAGSLFYLKRIRGNLFYDYMVGRGSFTSTGLTEKPVFLKSQGVELYADYHVLRFIFELSSGLRLTYLPEEKSIGAQILFTVNLDKFL